MSLSLMAGTNQTCRRGLECRLPGGERTQPGCLKRPTCEKYKYRARRRFYLAPCDAEGTLKTAVDTVAAIIQGVLVVVGGIHFLAGLSARWNAYPVSPLN
jgi:hypothetical protein